MELINSILSQKLLLSLKGKLQCEQPYQKTVKSHRAEKLSIFQFKTRFGIILENEMSQFQLLMGLFLGPVLFFPQVSNILSTLETVLTKGEVQSVVVEYEALNVIIR